MACFLTFYSYKGGVGRSLALANVAWLLAERGKRVVVVDMDLEAPSLHDLPELRPKAGPDAPGIIEYAAAYARLGRVPGIAGYLHECPQPPGYGSLWIVPAGRLSRGYAEQLGDLHWAHLHAEHGSEPFVEGLRQGLEEACAPHYVLIDSRTGLSDIGGLSTHRLADMVVLVFNLTPACLDGTVRAYRSMLREGSRVKQTFLVASPVPPVADADAPGSVIQRRLEQAQHLLSPKVGRKREILRLVYDPEMALAEELAVTQPRRFRAAAGVYEELREAIQLTNPEEIFRVQEEAGELIEQGRTGEAAELLQSVVDARPDDTDAQLALGSLLLSIGRSKEAVRCFRTATELSPNLALAHRKLGEALLAAGEARDTPDEDMAREALDALTAAERAGDTSAGLRLALATAHRQLGQYKEAALTLIPERDDEAVTAEHLLELRAAVEQHARMVGSPPGIDLLGLCDAFMSSLGINNRSKANFLRAILEDRLDARRLRELDRVLKTERDFLEEVLGPGAAALRDRISRTGIDPMDAEQLAALFDGTPGNAALVLLLVERQNEPHERLVWLQRGLAVEPENRRLLWRYALELLRQTGLDAETEIRARYEEAFEREPKDAGLPLDFGDWLTFVLAKHPDMPQEEARRLRQEAIELYRRAVDIEPDLHEALNNWGATLNEIAKLPHTPLEEARRLRQEVIELCRRAVDIKPDKYETLYNWGVQLSELAKLPGTQPEEMRRLNQEAIELYRRAVDIKPDQYEAFNNWGTALGELAKLPDNPPEEARRLCQEAIELYRRALAIKPDKYEALNGWAAQLLWLTHLIPQAAPQLLDQALALLERQAEILGKPVDRFYNYACVRAVQRRKAEALASLEHALEDKEIRVHHVRKDPDWQHWAGDDELEALLARFEEH